MLPTKSQDKLDNVVFRCFCRKRLSGAGTDGALRDGAGPELTDETEKIMAKRQRRALEVSEVVRTNAYNLNKRGVRGCSFLLKLNY